LQDFYELLIEYLKYAGYEPITSKEGKIVAEKVFEEDEQDKSFSGETQLELKEEAEKITFVIAGPVIHEDDLLRLEEAEGEAVLVVTEDPPDSVLNSVPKDTEVWDRDELIEKFGEMMLEKSFLEGVSEGIEGLKGPSNEIEFDIEHKGGERILAPIIDFEEVSELGEKLAKGFKYTLELVPHYLYQYHVDREDGETFEGKLYLNSISGKPNFWEKPFESIHEIKRSHVKLEPNISEDESIERAFSSIMNRHTEQKEVRWEEDGATIVEKEEVKPSKEDIVLRKKGMVYVPMWAVEGTEEIVVINAARGKIESELS